jgi:hypothetical protein
MGTASFTLGKAASGRGQGAPTLMSSDFAASGAFTTSTSGAYIEDSTSTDVEFAVGQIYRHYGDVAMRIVFGATATTDVTASYGHYLPANTLVEIEINRGQNGKAAIRDVA